MKTRSIAKKAAFLLPYLSRFDAFTNRNGDFSGQRCIGGYGVPLAARNSA